MRFFTYEIDAGAGARSLRAYLGRNKFKNRFCIIVESPYYHGIDGIFYIHSVKTFLNALKMLSALVAYIIEHFRRVLCY